MAVGKRKRTKLITKQVADDVAKYGLEAALLDRVAVDEIADDELSDMWSRAKTLLHEIELYLEENS